MKKRELLSWGDILVSLHTVKAPNFGPHGNFKKYQYMIGTWFIQRSYGTCKIKKGPKFPWGSKLGASTVAEDSKIPKMPVINPLQALVHPQTKTKNYPAWIVNPQHQLPDFALFGE